MKPKYIYLILTTYLLLTLFSIRILLLKPGTIGHRWDWGIPSTSQEIKQIFYQNIWAWNENSLGCAQASSFNSLPIKVFIGSFGFLGLGGPFVSKFLVILSIFCGANFMFLLIKTVTKKLWPAFLAGLFYGFSPFMFNALVGGAVTQYLSFAFIPLVFYWFERLRYLNCHPGGSEVLSLSKDGATDRTPFGIWSTLLKYSFLTALSLIPIFTAFPALIITLILLFGWIFIRSCHSEPSTNKAKFSKVIKSVIYFFTTLIFLVLLNAYSIFPYLASFGSFYQQEISAVDKSSIAENLSKYTASFWDTIIGTTFWEDAFRYVIPENFKPLILGAGYLLLAFSILAIAVKIIRKQSKPDQAIDLGLVGFLLSAFLIGSILASGNNSFLGDLVVAIMTRFLFLSIFRSPQWLVIIPNFCFAILLGLAVSYLENFNLKIKKLEHSPVHTSKLEIGNCRARNTSLTKRAGKLEILKIVPLILLAIFLFPFWKGTLGDEGLDVFQKNPDLKALEYLQQNRSVSEFSRTIFIPKNHSLIFLETDFQQKRQGNDPYLSFPPFLTTVTDFGEKISNELVHQIEKIFVLLGDTKNTAALFQKLGIDWIAMRHEAASMFYPFPHYSGWSSTLLTQRLSADKENFTWLYNGDLLTVFKALNKPYPPIFLTDDIAYIDAENKNLFDLSRLFNFKQTNLPVFAQEAPNVKKNKNILINLSNQIFSISDNTSNANAPNFIEIPKSGEYALNILNSEKEFFNYSEDGKLNILTENQTIIKTINLEATNSAKIKLDQGTYILQWPKMVPKNLFSSEDLSIKSFLPFGQYQIIIPPHSQPINVTITQQEGSHYELVPQRGTTLAPNSQTFGIIYQPLFYSKTARLIIDGMSENEIKQIFIRRLDQPKVIFTQASQTINETKPIIQPSFIKKSPTYYEVTDLEKISRLSKILVFNQSFSTDWEAFLINNDNGKTKIDENKHFLVNGFANGWVIENLDAVKKISIEYRLQKYVFAGGIISLITLIIGLCNFNNSFGRKNLW